MRFKPTPIEIPKDDPFKQDLLSRKQSAEVLTDFVSSLEEPFVLSLNSSFGHGKTTFLRMWVQHLRNQGFCCLCFNAWESDFTDSPLVSLIGEISTEIEALKLAGRNKKVAQFLKKTQKAGVALLKAALPVGVKLATSGLLDLSHIKEPDIAKAAEELVKKKIDKYKEDKKTIHHFREQLGHLVKELAETESQNPKKPIVFAIDELDRCRPTYAIELLEKIKHLFSVEGLVFVLAIDRHQLSESIKSAYGTGMDTDGYLRRFIDIEFCLPDPDPKAFVEGQFARFGLNEAFANKLGDTRTDAGFIRDALPPLFSLLRFSLRTQEQCFTHIVLVLRTTPPNSFLYGFFLSLLICLRNANRSLYYRYCLGETGVSEVLDWIKSLAGGKEFLDTGLGIVVEADLISGTRDFKKLEEAKGRIKQLADNQVAHTDEVKRARHIAEHWRHASFRRPDDLTGYLYPKIEFLARFVKLQPEAQTR